MSAPANVSAFFKGIRKNVVALGVVSFFTDISSEMLYPIIPIFLTSVLGAPMSVIGLIEGIAESTASILKAVSGWLSDRLAKRKIFVVAGYSLSAVAKPLLFFAYVWPTVLAARFFDRFGKGLRTSAKDAIIADSCDPAYRGKAFGLQRAMDSLGACLGPLIALLLLNVFKENLRVVFLIALIPAAIAVAMLVIFVSEPKGLTRLTNGFCYGPHCLSADFKKFLIISSIFAIGNSSDAFLILRCKNLGFSTTLVILAYALYNFSYSALSVPFGVLSDKISRKAVLIAGFIVFALVYIGFAVMKASAWVWPLFFIYGFYIAITDGVGKAFITDMVGREYRGTALGLYHGVTGFMTFFASLIAGLLWAHIGASAPFFYGAIMAILSCAAFIILMR